MQGLADPDQRFVDEVVTIAAMHSTSPESTQRTLRFMALAAFASMASMRVVRPDAAGLVPGVQRQHR